MPLEAVLDAVPELRAATSVEPLTGGLTNTNWKVTSPSGCYVVRISGKDTNLLAIDRENELHNTIAAAETGVGAPFVAAVPEHDALVLGFLEGEVMDAEKSGAATGSALSRTRADGCTQDAASSTTSTCSRSRRVTSRSSASGASASPTGTSSSSHRSGSWNARCERARSRPSRATTTSSPRISSTSTARCG